MKSYALTLLTLLFLTPQGAWADAEKIRTIDLTQQFADAEVDMSNYDDVRILVRSDRAKPEVTTEGDLATCVVQSVRRVSPGKYEIRLDFQAQMDDGRNACTVKIRPDGGRVAQVVLFLDIIDR